MTKRRRNAPRDYPRTARLNELLREIVAAELDRIDDDRLGWVSIAGVDVDNELTKARIYLSTLEPGSSDAATVLDEHKGRFRKAIGDQAQLRKVPELEFIGDPAINTGGRVEEILSELRQRGDFDETTTPTDPATDSEADTGSDTHSEDPAAPEPDEA